MGLEVRRRGRGKARKWARYARMFSWLSLRTRADSNGIQAAPKIGESNIGFKMLASMGWEEGVRIGGEDRTGGIDVPLTAVVKTTKLGLGATR